LIQALVWPNLPSLENHASFIMTNHFHGPSRIFVQLLCAALIFSFLGCGDSEDAFKVERNPRIELSLTKIEFQKGGSVEGEKAYEAFVITNTGDEILEIQSIELVYSPDLNTSPGEATNPAFFLDLVPEPGAKIGPVDGSAAGEPGVVERGKIKVGYQFYDDDLLRTAKLVITHNDVSTGTVEIPIAELGAAPALQTAPSEVVFQNVQEGKFDEKVVSLLNTGAAALEITRVQMAGATQFVTLVDPEDEASLMVVNSPVDFEPPLSIGPGSSYSMKVRFTPEDESPREGELVVFSNDPTYGEGFKVPLRGNQQGPCIEVEPPSLNFGMKLVGKSASLPVTIKSCGKDNLQITEIKVAEAECVEDSDCGLGYDCEAGVCTGAVEKHRYDPSLFNLDTASFAVMSQGGAWPTPTAPRVVPINQSATFEIIYSPDKVSCNAGESDCDDAQLPPSDPLPDAVRVDIATNTFEGVVSVDVAGFGTNTPCPTAVISILEGGAEVPPQTTMKLSGEGSLPNEGVITEWSWDVTQPLGSKSVFFPSAAAPQVDFEVNVSGKYTFRLEVLDSEAWSCVPAEREVIVIPDEAIHVELTWETPQDADPTDEGKGAGTDLDLHFVHWNNAAVNPNGEDLYPPGNGDGQPEGYFDDIWDCFWFYPTRDWGVPGLGDDDPSLDRDDLDGAGPENLNLNAPEAGVTYKVGVHYWNDWGYGLSTPTVNIYLFGSLKELVTGCPLSRYDMWEVGTIEWPSYVVDVWECESPIPAEAGASWPSRPCGNSQNQISDTESCPYTIIPNYEPSKFVIPDL